MSDEEMASADRARGLRGGFTYGEYFAQEIIVALQCCGGEGFDADAGNIQVTERASRIALRSHGAWREFNDGSEYKYV